MEFNNSSPNLSVRLRDLYKCNNVKKGISVRTTFLRLSADPRLSAPRKNALLTSFSWNEWPLNPASASLACTLSSTTQCFIVFKITEET